METGTIEVILNCWNFVKETPTYHTDLGVKISERILIHSPKLAAKLDQQQWKQPRNDACSGDVGLHHAMLFVSMLDTLIKLLDPEFMPVFNHTVIDLGKKHATFGLSSMDFPVFGKVLVAAMEDLVGSDYFTYAVREAWRDMWRWISLSMIQGVRSESVDADVTPPSVGIDSSGSHESHTRQVPCRMGSFRRLLGARHPDIDKDSPKNSGFQKKSALRRVSSTSSRNHLLRGVGSKESDLHRLPAANANFSLARSSSSRRIQTGDETPRSSLGRSGGSRSRLLRCLTSAKDSEPAQHSAANATFSLSRTSSNRRLRVPSDERLTPLSSLSRSGGSRNRLLRSVSSKESEVISPSTSNAKFTLTKSSSNRRLQAASDEKLTPRNSLSRSGSFKRLLRRRHAVDETSSPTETTMSSPSSVDGFALRSPSGVVRLHQVAKSSLELPLSETEASEEQLTSSSEILKQEHYPPMSPSTMMSPVGKQRGIRATKSCTMSAPTIRKNVVPSLEKSGGGIEKEQAFTERRSAFNRISSFKVRRNVQHC
eukprot:Nitzschia sp. Nitz4//scaffold21_size171442//119971//121655//NITZ4_002179-RA/size171442-augustus-gene-0.189-mRNA-1//1//CDS//3329542465//9338//frame0